MEEAQKTRKDICEALGLSYFTVTDWVKGKKMPRMDKVEKLAKYFNCLISELIEEPQKQSTEHSSYIRKDKEISLFEYNLIQAYRQHPEHQTSINALLGISSAENIAKFDTNKKPVFVAAASGKNYDAKEPDIRTIAEIEKMQKKHNK
jgi:transcriptional regulator with XRE-family HTH domain